MTKYIKVKKTIGTFEMKTMLRHYLYYIFVPFLMKIRHYRHSNPKLQSRDFQMSDKKSICCKQEEKTTNKIQTRLCAVYILYRIAVMFKSG